MCGVSNQDNQKLIKIKEKFIGKLYQQLEAAYGRLAQVVGADEVRVQDEIESLLKKIEVAEADLKQKETSKNNSNPNREHLNIEKKLPDLDFDKQKKIFEKILKRFTDTPKAAPPILLQNSYQKSGDLYVLAIKQQLESQGELKYYPVQLTDESPSNEYGFLDRFAGQIDITPIPDITQQPQYIQKIIDKICGSVRGGTTIFIDFHAQNKIVNPDQFLLWFMDKFWHPLLNRLPNIAQDYRNVKFIAFLCFNKKLPPQCSKLSCYCTQSKLDPNKILKISLQDWKQSDIEGWLQSSIGLKISTSEVLAQEIYDNTQGIPDSVKNWTLNNSARLSNQD